MTTQISQDMVSVSIELNDLQSTVFALGIVTSRHKQSVSSSQMLHNVLSDQGLPCLPLIQQLLVISTGNKMDLFKI